MTAWVRKRKDVFALALALALLAGLAAAQTGGRANSPKGASPAAVENGKQIYQSNCAICHYSTSAAKKIGPGMKGIYARGKFADGKKVDDTSMRIWIEKGGKDMAAYEETLSARQIADLIAYLKTL